MKPFSTIESMTIERLNKKYVESGLDNKFRIINLGISSIDLKTKKMFSADFQK
jgi:hypothetical protein